MNKLIIKLKYKPTLNRFSFTRRKKFVLKFDEILNENIEFFDISASFDKNKILNIKILQSKEEIKNFNLLLNDVYFYKPNFKDLNVEYLFELK